MGDIFTLQLLQMRLELSTVTTQGVFNNSKL